MAADRSGNVGSDVRNRDQPRLKRTRRRGRSMSRAASARGNYNAQEKPLRCAISRQTTLHVVGIGFILEAASSVRPSNVRGCVLR